jgi:hypothetical protein
MGVLPIRYPTVPSTPPPRSGIGVEQHIGCRQILVEGGAGVGGFNEDNPDAKDPNFVVEGFGIALHGMFGRGVKCHVRRGHKAKHQADVDDTTAALPVLTQGVGFGVPFCFSGAAAKR